MIFFPYLLLHALIVGALALTGIGAVVLLLLIAGDFMQRKIW